MLPDAIRVVAASLLSKLSEPPTVALITYLGSCSPLLFLTQWFFFAGGVSNGATPAEMSGMTE